MTIRSAGFEAFQARLGEMIVGWSAYITCFCGYASGNACSGSRAAADRRPFSARYLFLFRPKCFLRRKFLFQYNASSAIVGSARYLQKKELAVSLFPRLNRRQQASPYRFQWLGRLLVILALPVTFVVSPSAHAGPILSGHEDHKLFGSLDQADTACQDLGCGPTAAVNSFIFLQHMYPEIYGDKLVPITPFQGGEPSLANQVAVANLLLGPNYMNTDCATCGTSPENFFNGKKTYIDQQAPGSTKYDFQSLIDNRPITAPTGEFISSELNNGEDVEALISNADNTFGHWITLTDFTFDTRDSTGSISFIDPLGGIWKTFDITGMANNGAFTLNYSTDCPVCQITDVITESPDLPTKVPEPSSMSIIIAPLLFVLWLNFRRRRVA